MVEPNLSQSLSPLSDAIIEKLLHRHRSGFDFTLERITKLLQKLGNPQQKLPPVIHIAGTNGKGSHTAFCRAILEAAGYKVHVHSSPHLVSWVERFRIKGQLISDAVLADLLSDIAKIAEDNVTIFEMLTAAAMLVFSQEQADVAIFEVGLGGRLDATNVIEQSCCSIITPISLDHCAILGDNIEKITAEKAAIIKPNCPVVASQQAEGAMQIIKQKARQMAAPLYQFGIDYKIEALDGAKMLWQDIKSQFMLPLPNLAGKHQIINAASSIMACKIFDPKLSSQIVAQGMAQVEWAARLQHIKAGILWQQISPYCSALYLDGAHNEDGARSLKDFIRERGIERQDCILICGILNTKNCAAFFKQLDGIFSQIECVNIQHSNNAVSAEDLAVLARQFLQSPIAVDVRAHQNILMAIEALTEELKGKDARPTIFIAGSLHLAGEFLQLNNTPPR